MSGAETFDHSRCRFYVGQRVRALLESGPVHGVVRDTTATAGGWLYGVDVEGLPEMSVFPFLGDELQAWSGDEVQP